MLFATAPVRPTLVGIAALLASVTLHAAIQQAAPELPAAYSGTWKDTDIGMIAVHPSGNALEVWGTDRASIYRTVCIVDPKDSTVATCAGDGFNHLERLRFSYRSRFKLDAAAHGGAGQITEDWEAQLATGTVRGRVVFKRQAQPASR